MDEAGQLASPSVLVPVGLQLAVIGEGVRMPVDQMAALQPRRDDVPIEIEAAEVAPVVPVIKPRLPVYAPKQDRN